MNNKYIIGLTGNIATGKSIVRRMLQELGASTVDADSLVHLLQKPGTQVYKNIIETFGTFILQPDATINRGRLANIAFSSPEALKALEAITHPAVRQYIERAIVKAPKDVVVVEAIKLIESGLADHCDAIWVVHAPEDTQMVRLMTKRHLTSQEAMQRVKTQSPQADKLAKADVVIENSSDLITTWNLVQKHYSGIAKPEAAPTPEPIEERPTKATEEQPLDFRRAKRGDLTQMAALIAAATQGEIELDESDMMERLFSKGYLVAMQGEAVMGLVGWQTENLIAGVDDFFVKTNSLWSTVGTQLIERVEEAVAELSCEAGLVFVHDKAGPVARKCLEKKGYKEMQIDDMKDRMWREAALDWSVDNTTLMVKQLMERRINTPI